MENNENILKEKAYKLHIEGKLDEARTIYELILRDNPDNLSVTFLYAQLLLTQQEFDKAIEFFNKVYKKTQSDDIKMNIVNAYHGKGDYNSALKEIDEIKNKTANVYSVKANIYVAMNDYEKAINTYELAYNTDNSADYALLNISVLYKTLNNIEKAYEYAIKAYEVKKDNLKNIMNAAEISEISGNIDNLIFFLTQAEKLNPEKENLLLKIAFVYEQKLDFPNAVLYYSKVLNINKDNYLALIKIANMYIEVKNAENAFKYIEAAAKLKPNEYNTIHAYYKYYLMTENTENAVKYAKKLIEIQPDNIIGYDALYSIYYSLFDYISAIECCDKALKIEPDNVDILCKKAICLSTMGKNQEAIDLLEKNKFPNSFIYRKIHSFNRLKNKNYQDGMEYYRQILSPVEIEVMKNEYYKTPYKCEEKFKEYYKHQWNREPINNKTLLIHQGPHGLGDYMMFTRYIPLLEKKAGKLVIEASDNLYELFKLNFKNSIIIKDTKEAYKDYDYTSSGMNLLYSMNLDFDNIVKPEGWLEVPENIFKQSLLNSLFAVDKLKIGIFWQGNKNVMENRAVPFSDLAPLFELDNCQFYSFDLADKDKKTSELFEQYKIIDLKNNIKSSLDTAICMKNLDIFITVDSYPLHLAGALGIKTFMMLTNKSEWRWFNDTKTTPWYNSVTIFKQEATPSWNKVMQDIKKELINYSK